MLKKKQSEVSFYIVSCTYKLLILNLGESYQIAKTYKFLGDKMEKLTKILADLEFKKRRAVEIKNYDEAEKIKVHS
jgi:hypothetical protein